MEWYLVVAIAYGVYILILWSVYYCGSVYKPFKLSNLFSKGILYLLVLIFIIPGVWLWNMITPIEKYGMWQYKVYSAKPLTENDKIALLNLGFLKVTNEKDYVCGLRFSGYRKGYIVVQENGEISVKYTAFIDNETKHLIKIIQRFPTMPSVDSGQTNNAKSS